MDKKIIVFGGAGFVGSHTADALTDAGYEVTIFDCKESLYLRPEQKMIVGDILDEKLVEDVVKGCKAVYNFAGIADIDEASLTPMKSIKINILGTAIIVEACYKAKVERFVFASSLYVYSRMGSFYKSTKQACEILIENYGEIGLPYTIIRYGSLYGPRSDKRNFINRILTQALIEGKIVREGDGEELREYIHVYDAAKWGVEILDDEFINQYIIFTGQQQIKIKDLLLMIQEMIGDKIELEYLTPTITHHYNITPYSFIPKISKRYINKTYLDLGQGILDYMHNMEENND